MLQIINKTYLLNHRWLIGILLFGLILRVVGIDHGYPYILNIDEPTIVRSSLGLLYSWDIGHFDWPHLPFYLNYIFYIVFIKARGLLQILQLRRVVEWIFPILWNDPFVFYFITRFLNAVFGTLTLIPTYLLARDMFSKKIAIISALILAITPYHVFITHMAIPDPLLLFFVSWAIYYAFRFSITLKYSDAVVAGLMFGFASSVKYNAIILSLILLLFVFRRLKISNQLDKTMLIDVFKKLVVFGIASIIGLLATSPNIITDWGLFWSYEYGKGFLWQLTVNSDPLSMSEYFPALYRKIKEIIIDTGFVIPFLFMYAIYMSVQKNISREQSGSIWILSAVIILFIMFTSRYSRANSHYYLSIYSVFIIVAAWGFSHLKIKFIQYAFISILVVMSIYEIMLFVREDTRDIAFRYYEAAKYKDGSIYIDGNDLSEADMTNNTNMKRARNGYELGVNDVLISETEVTNNDKIVLIENISNFFRKGPILYVYKQAN